MKKYLFLLLGLPFTLTSMKCPKKCVSKSKVTRTLPQNPERLFTSDGVFYLISEELPINQKKRYNFLAQRAGCRVRFKINPDQKTMIVYVTEKDKFQQFLNK